MTYVQIYAYNCYTFMTTDSNFFNTSGRGPATLTAMPSEDIL